MISSKRNIIKNLKQYAPNIKHTLLVLGVLYAFSLLTNNEKTITEEKTKLILEENLLGSSANVSVLDKPKFNQNGGREEKRTYDELLKRIDDLEKKQAPLNDSIALKQASINRKARKKKPRGHNRVKEKKSYMISFSGQIVKKEDETIRIPALTNIKGTILTGGHVGQFGEGEKGFRTPLLVQLDYAANMANDFKLVDLVGCYALGKSNGNKSSGRVDIDFYKFVCLSKNETLELDNNQFSAYSVGEDNDFGVEAELDDFNLSRKASMAFLTSVISGIGSAFANLGITATTTPLGGITSTLGRKNIASTALGNGASSGADAIAQYYLKQVNEMVPLLKVYSGQTVTMVIEKGFDIPKKFFTKGKNNEVLYSSIRY